MPTCSSLHWEMCSLPLLDGLPRMGLRGFGAQLLGALVTGERCVYIACGVE